MPVHKKSQKCAFSFRKEDKIYPNFKKNIKQFTESFEMCLNKEKKNHDQ